MIVTRVKQTVQKPLKMAEYQIETEEKNIVGNAHAEVGIMLPKLRYHMEDEDYFLKYNHKQGILQCEIFDNRREITGQFIMAKQKGSFLKFGYTYVHAFWKKQEYNIYEVGLGKDGIYFPCYERGKYGDGKQVGMIHKEAVVVDLKDEYMCYSINENCMMLLNLFSLYTDILKYRNSGKEAKGEKYQYLYCTNKALKNKYNPNFLLDENKD